MKPEEREPTIQLLDEILIDQIAAGEVVERPANAVKELIENAIDAGAEKIEIEIEDGGKALIRITDDGAGMIPRDASRSIRRHATSKLREFDDLSRLTTLGFRGEALASIASVSKLSLRTRPHDALRGTELLVEGGELIHTRPAGGAAGTTIEVRELFYNVPARQKFMKASQTEAARIHQIVTRAAMARPDIHFIYKNQGRTIRSLPPALGVLHRAMAIFEEDDFIEFTHVEGDLRFEALLAPERTSSNRNHFFLFINERSVSDAGILKSVALGFPEPIPGGRYPIGALYLQLPRHEIDINVHPQKTEVRLTDSRRRLDQIRRAVRRALSREQAEDAAFDVGRGSDAPPSVPFPADYWEERLDRQRRQREDPARAEEGPPGLFPRDTWGIAEALRGAGALEPSSRPSSRIGGSERAEPGPLSREERLYRGAPIDDPRRDEPALRGSDRDMLAGLTSSGHLLIEAGSTLLIVSGRAAIAALNERRYGAEGEAPRMERRRLIFPARLEIAEAERVDDEDAARLERLGFEISAIGPETLAIRSVPAWLEALAPEEALAALVAGKDEAAALRSLFHKDAALVPVIDQERARELYQQLSTEPALLQRLAKRVALHDAPKESPKDSPKDSREERA